MRAVSVMVRTRVASGGAVVNDAPAGYHRPSMVLSLPRLLAIGATVLVLLVASAPASAQLFFSTQPNTGFHVGPLIVRANVNPGDPVAHVNVLWSVVPPPTRTAGAAPQDFYLLWPGEVNSEASRGARRGPAGPAGCGAGADGDRAGLRGDRGRTAPTLRAEPGRSGGRDQGGTGARRGPLRPLRAVRWGPGALPARHLDPHSLVVAPTGPALAHGSALPQPLAGQAQEGLLGGGAGARREVPHLDQLQRGARPPDVPDVLRQPRPRGAAGRCPRGARGELLPLRRAEDRRGVAAPYHTP